ncbi:Hypothetical protein SRAE_X000141100 [Strongyloides ratti]|uniref:Integrase_H2C2 domain-containing protein n=1 Tax=Strongyloides ratti TaxID=34506 RepID=A0A090KUX7_STRRB|nr:Hypothetical protein SRAE_X000141100 [Strongyloides ratti]CEF59665.1 Hypothetical protein SRAE_X000141100 [Strongyloides ratti]
MKLSVKKCKFGTNKDQLIGWKINEGIEIPEEKLKRLYSLPVPLSKEELKSTLAKFQFKAQCIPEYSKYAAPLHKYTGTEEFDEEKVRMQFQKLKEYKNECETFFFRRREDIEVRDSLVLVKDRIIVPAQVIKKVAKKLHEGHRSGSAMIKEAKRYFWFENMENVLMKEYRKCDK